MSPQEVIGSLRQLCRDIDEGRTPRRLDLRKVLIPLAVPAALGFGLLSPGCDDEGREIDPPYEVCDNGADDDHDGVADCDDADCRTEPPCGVYLYGLSFEDCEDGVDNDGDGLVDCGDDDCETFAACTPEYAVAFEVCTDGVDNDGDGLVDCNDDDCYGEMECTMAGYGVFGEICDNSADDDYDELIDCDDPDCSADIACAAQALYGDFSPIETICDDGLDNDGDELTDCDDPDCVDCDSGAE